VSGAAPQEQALDKEDLAALVEYFELLAEIDRRPSSPGVEKSTD
jgi:hypothetical protein